MNLTGQLLGMWQRYTTKDFQPDVKTTVNKMERGVFQHRFSCGLMQETGGRVMEDQSNLKAIKWRFCKLGIIKVGNSLAGSRLCLTEIDVHSFPFLIELKCCLRRRS